MIGAVAAKRGRLDAGSRQDQPWSLSVSVPTPLVKETAFSCRLFRPQPKRSCNARLSHKGNSPPPAAPNVQRVVKVQHVSVTSVSGSALSASLSGRSDTFTSFGKFDDVGAKSETISQDHDEARTGNDYRGSLDDYSPPRWRGCRRDWPSNQYGTRGGHS
jgi:hypothetical protein